jgi:hypothetical protein
MNYLKVRECGSQVGVRKSGSPEVRKSVVSESAWNRGVFFHGCKNAGANALINVSQLPLPHTHIVAINPNTNHARLPDLRTSGFPDAQIEYGAVL